MYKEFIVPMKTSLNRISIKRSELMMDIEKMAASRLQEKGPEGKLSGNDVKALLARAYHDGKVDASEVKQLNQVRDRYQDKMDHSARNIFNEFSAAWIQDTREQLQEAERQNAQAIEADNADFYRTLDEGDRNHNYDLEIHQEKRDKSFEAKEIQLERSPLEINQKEAATLDVFFGHKKQ